MRAKVSFSPTSSRLQPTFQGVNSAASSPINIPSLEAKHGPVFSPNHLPPEDFTLNEGLAGTVRNGHARDGLGISSNSNRVTSYMKALEDYLQVSKSDQISSLVKCDKSMIYNNLGS